MNSTQPTDAVLDAMVERVEDALLAPRRHSGQHHRRLAVLSSIGAGVLLIAAAASVTAVAFPTRTNPLAGTSEQDADGNNIAPLLSISCDNELHMVNHVYGPGRVPGLEAARRDPASVCPSDPTAAAVHDAIEAEATSREASGATCGNVSIDNSDVYSWRSQDGSGAASLVVTDITESSLPSGCGNIVNLTVAPGPGVPLAACAYNTRSAFVDVLPAGETAETYCDSFNESVWKG
jgi:hypothetical protein